MPILDVVAVMIAFAAVMALLSLVVTAMVQLTGHLIGLRGRNLEWGLQHVLTGVLEMDAIEAKRLATKVTNAARLLPGGEPQAVGMMSNLWVQLTTPLVTWIESEKLVGYLKQAGVDDISRTNQKKLQENFTELEGYLKKRFALHARLWAILWAAFIAIYFQVSTPDLLDRLSTDANIRNELVAEAEALVAKSEGHLQNIPDYEDVGPTALTTLIGKHKKLERYIRQAAGAGNTRKYLIQELELVLADVPEQRDAIVKEYGELLDKQYKASVEKAAGQTDYAKGRLAKFKIEPWKQGWGFYQQSSNVFGVFITAILLSLGAPFWFEWLGRLLKLRDVLGGANKDEPSDAPTNNA